MKFSKDLKKRLIGEGFDAHFVKDLMDAFEDIPTQEFARFSINQLDDVVDRVIQQASKGSDKPIKVGLEEKLKIIQMLQMDQIASIRATDEPEDKEKEAPEKSTKPLVTPRPENKLLNFKVQLIEADTKDENPLSGFKVKIFHFKDKKPEEIYQSVTDKQGRFTFSYKISAVNSSKKVKHNFELHIFDAECNEVYKTKINVTLGKDDTIVIKVPIVAYFKKMAVPIDDLSKELNISLPSKLIAKLKEININSLKDIRRHGGLGNIKDLPVPSDHKAILHLEALARLNVLSRDMKINTILIENGYQNIHDITREPQSVFIKKVSYKLDPMKAEQVYVQAKTQYEYLKNVLTMIRVDKSNGYTSKTISNIISGPFFENTCECQDCHSAVSPLAYLADLLNYVLGHVKARSLNHGLKGEYYNHTDEKPRLTRIDKKIDFSWQNNSPHTTINRNNFFVRWSGKIQPAYSEKYIFITRSDDGVRVWVDDTLIIDNWTDHSEATDTGVIELKAGHKYDIRIEYYEKGGSAVIKLLWKSPSLNKEIIPEHSLFHESDERIPIDLDFLSKRFHQDFASLPTSCQVADEKVRQVRLCIEVIRKHLESLSVNLNRSELIAEAEKKYLIEVYQSLLNQTGTSYDEIRLSQGAGIVDRKSIADRLGISLSDTSPDELDRLLLFFNSADSSHQLNESSLERIFGLTDTKSDPFSTGEKSNDPSNEIQRWILHGVEWNRNTDINGKIYIQFEKLTRPSGVRAKLFRDSEHTQLVASGERRLLNDKIKLIAHGSSNLIGHLEGRCHQFSNDVIISAVPEFLSWKLKQLRKVWKNYDWPSDPYSRNSKIILPIIDPDLIGPDDFRKPKKNEAAFKIWKERREWVDDQLRMLNNDNMKKEQPASISNPVVDNEGNTVKVPDISKILNKALKSRALNAGHPNGNPPNKPTWEMELSDIKTEFDALDPTRRESAKDRIKNDIGMNEDEFIRVLNIKTKDQKWWLDSRSQPVEDTEWSEFYSILVQVQKRAVFSKWRSEEEFRKIWLWSETFWISLKEPKEGIWSYELNNIRPFIDPESCKLSDLPNSSIGQRSVHFWKERRKKLDDTAIEIKFLREQKDQNRPEEGTAGLIAILDDALGTSTSEDTRLLGEITNGDPTWYEIIDKINSKLLSHEASSQSFAMEVIDSVLHMTIENFKYLIKIRDQAKQGVSDPSKKPTFVEWDDLYSILLHTKRERIFIPKWIDEENQEIDGEFMQYWAAIKARLPRWRSSKEARIEWQQALLLRAKLPIIDPDQIGVEYIREPNPENKAFDFWIKREDRLGDIFDKLKDSRIRFSGSDLEWLESWMTQTNLKLSDNFYLHALGLDSAELDNLSDPTQSEQISILRLNQLSITQTEFNYLLKARELIKQNGIIDQEWDNIYHIIIQTMKRRQLFSLWKLEEKAQEIIKGPDYFKFPESADVIYIRSKPHQKWRMDQKDFKEWKNTLRTRIDQDLAIMNANKTIVCFAEESALTILRDGLINALPYEMSFSDKVKWITEELLINASAGGCQLTTRISQAIETLQTMVWSIRTGQIESVNELFLDTENLDEEWKWMGSYATWRSAIFVYLYPENLLYPTLRRWQTPAFRQLVQKLQKDPVLTSEKACELANTYTEYFQDICSLKLDATCQANSLVKQGNCRDRQNRSSECRDLFFMFGRGGLSNTVYWSVCGLGDESCHPQSTWEVVPGLEDVVNIIGAVPYSTTDGNRFIYLFARVSNDKKQQLIFIKYDLDRDIWSETSDEIELPEETDKFEAVIKQRNNDHEPPYLSVRIPSGAIYGRQLNSEGDAWSNDDWYELVDAVKGSEFPYLLAMVDSRANNYYLFVQNNERKIFYRIGLSSGPAVTSTGRDHMEIFIKDSDDKLLFSSLNSRHRWNQFRTINGNLNEKIKSNPTAVGGTFTSGLTNQDQQLIKIFAIDFNNALYCINKEQSTISIEENTLSDPNIFYSITATLHEKTTGNGDIIEIFGRNKNNWMLFNSTIPFNELINLHNIEWNRIGGLQLTSDPSAVSWGTDRIEVFARGKDNGLWHIGYDGSNWSDHWLSLNKTITSAPSACSRNENRIDVFARGIDNELCHIYYNGSNWSLWENLGGFLTSNPAAISIEKNRIDVFARGKDKSLIWKRYDENNSNINDNHWSEWIPLHKDNKYKKILSEHKDEGLISLRTGNWIGAFTLQYGNRTCSFWKEGNTLNCLPMSYDRPFWLDKFLPNVTGIEKIAVHCDWLPKRLNNRIGYQGDSLNPGVFRIPFKHSSEGDEIRFYKPIRLTPHVPVIMDITAHLTDSELETRRVNIKNIFGLNQTASKSTMAYLEEAFYSVPILLAQHLQRSGEYVGALDWFRTVYNYHAPEEHRKIYYGLEEESLYSTSYQRQRNWLSDPLNPHNIASLRKNSYTRFTIISLIRCLLEYADSEFTFDTSESIPKARTLYMTAIELLDSDEIKQHLESCDNIIGNLKIQIDDIRYSAVLKQIVDDLYLLPNKADLKNVRSKLIQTMKQQKPMEYRINLARELVNKALSDCTPTNNFFELFEQKNNLVNQLHNQILSNEEIVQTLRKLSIPNEESYFHEISQLNDTNKPLPGTDIHTESMEVTIPLSMIPIHSNVNIHSPALKPPKRFGYSPDIQYSFCIPVNPIIDYLRLHAELNLHKIQTCRNIVGMERKVELYAAPTGTMTGIPSIGDGEQLSLQGTVNIYPTQYRYITLIERSKQLVNIAQQLEAAFLSSLEKRDAELYNQIKAKQDMDLASAGVQLHKLRVTEAGHGKRLAELQKERAVIQENHYEDLIQEGWLWQETAGIIALSGAALLHLAAGASALLLLGTGGTIGAGAGGAVAAPTAGTVTPATVPAGAATGVGAGMLVSQITGGLSSLAAAASLTASLLQTWASYERRAQEWEFQKQIAAKDVVIGDQQIFIAEDREKIAGQELEIAKTQSEHAKDVVEFLNNKFTNAELYEWMSGVLEGVYRYFLRQATALARLAENQLAFERQETPPAYIQTDYWDIPSEGGTIGINSESDVKDRRGLTGSAKLLQDIYKLDQHAFETDKRKLQLTKTISLAQLDPFAFQRFVQTGVMVFETPMRMFDQDFPGHYLRLIKRVRTSVLALIPPTEGIKATLQSSGISRVVIGGNVFQETIIRRDPESISLTSPLNATGLFELQQESHMMLPFESSGVNMVWEFRMPKASNPFDFRTIADVLITIEYTALDSYDYRQQVVRQLDRNVSADRAFSFRLQFPDQWYALNNPDQDKTPMAVAFEIRRGDFPPNIQDLNIQQVLLYFVMQGGKQLDEKITLELIDPENGLKYGGSATPIENVISTRSGNAADWLLIGKMPAGNWELKIADSQKIRDLFKNNEIEDILFVITYAGETPEWPE